MDRKTVKRILDNNRIVSFVEDLQNKIDKKLAVKKHGRVFVVFSGPFNAAVGKKDYIEFEKEEDAADFLASYKTVFESVPVEEMDQKEYEVSRDTVKWKYEGTIQDGNFKAVAERVA